MTDAPKPTDRQGTAINTENDNPESNANPAPAPNPTQAPRQRLKELLAIPERTRTDAEWDEINELEISLAQGNREGGPDPNLQKAKQNQLGGKPKNQGGQRKPFQKNNNNNQKRNQQRGRGGRGE